MATESAYKAKISLAFDYKAQENSSVKRYNIPAERITYVMIEHLYNNEHILPVIYISVKLESAMYSNVMNTVETSKFYLKISKYNALSNSSAAEIVVNDTFSYVTSSTTANYSSAINKNAPDGSSYMSITIGLVSSTMTNLLRKSFNGIYKGSSLSSLINMAIAGLPNMVFEPITYDKTYDSILIPPMASIYKFLDYLFTKDPFYDSLFTLYMDFKKTYLISSHAEPVSANDGNPTTVIVQVKNYNSNEAYKEGFSIQNGAYVVYVNASNTQMVINNAAEKVGTNLVGYSDDGGTQDLNMYLNNSESNTTKTTFVRTRNAAAIKNEIQSNSVLLEILKQNLDTEIFTPNKVYKVTNYEEYSKYDGNYTLASKKECYYQTAGKGEFIVTCNIGLRKVEDEEKAGALKDSTFSTARKTSSGTYSIRKTSSTKTNKTTSASRTSSK